MKFKKIFFLILLSIYIVLWFGGLYTYLFNPGLLSIYPWSSQIFLLILGILFFLSARSSQLLSLLFIVLIGYFSEVVGVFLGFPFGEYVYTNSLGIKIFGVPIVLGIAWLVLVLLVQNLMLYSNFNPKLRPWLGALLMVALDLTLDPVAANALNFWNWGNKSGFYGIPLSNFVGWFLVSFIIFVVVQKNMRFNSTHFLLGISQVLFFLIIAMVYGYFWPVVFSVFVFLVVYWFFKNSPDVALDQIPKIR